MDGIPPGQFYRRVSVKRVINAASWITAAGGSIMPEPVLEAMEDASHWFVDMHELNRQAGKVIAGLTGSEAAFVTAGASAGMMLQAAAVMTGTDIAKVHQLPDSAGMKNEIVIHRAHRVEEDRNYRTAGATLVEIGNSYGAQEWELADAINGRTAAVAYIFGTRRAGAVPLARVLEIAHSRGVPVIVDAAAMLPPAGNLMRFIAMGADMVTFSGGKGLRGPQSTGILCGRKELIEAAYMSSSPNHDGVGRSAKVCKEEIAGLVVALELFADMDHRAEAAGWRAKCERVVAGLQGFPGLGVRLADAELEWDEVGLNYPRAVISFEKEWRGPSESEVKRLLRAGDPGIWVGSAGYYGGIAIVPVNLQEGEEDLIVRRLREILKPGG